MPGSRGTNPNTAWPPRGVAVELDNVVDCASVAAGEGTLTVTLALELYDETSAFGRRIKMLHNCTSSLYVFNVSVSVLAPAHDRSITPWADEYFSQAPTDPYTGVTFQSTGFLPITGMNYPSPAGAVTPFGPGLSDWRAGVDFESFFLVEVRLLPAVQLCYRLC